MVRVVLKSLADIGHASGKRIPNAPTDWLIASGNSGTDPVWHGGTSAASGAQWLARQALGLSSGFIIEKSTIAGSPMTWRMENAPTTGPHPAVDDLTGLATLMMTDNSALASRVHPTIAVDWAEKAWAVGAELLFWIPQVRTIDAYGPEGRWPVVRDAFETWMDQVNRAKPNDMPRCRIIPGGWCYDLIRRDQANGVAPTATWFDDLYNDDFHMNDTGSYITAMIHAAYLWQIDPFLMPDHITGLNGSEPFPDAAYIKGKVSQALKTYPRAEIDTSGWA